MVNRSQEREKILVADDNQASRYALERILTSAGYQVTAVKNGSEGLSKFKEDKPDLLISDMDMPVMNGFELAEKIRCNEEFAHIPIIFVSAMYKDLTSKVRAIDLGGNDYLTQPIDNDELLFKVKAMLRVKKLYDALGEAQLAMQRSEHRYRTVADLATDYIFDLSVGKDGRMNVEWISEGFSRATGYAPQEVASPQLWENLVCEQDIPALRRFFESVLSDKRSECEIRFTTRRGDILWFELTGCPEWDMWRQRIDRILLAAKDVTERKQSEGERDRLIEELQEALANVKLLSGMLPICASCKKIRDDQGYWKQVEVYIHEHSEAVFSHGICPECAVEICKGIDDEE